MKKKNELSVIVLVLSILEHAQCLWILLQGFATGTVVQRRFTGLVRFYRLHDSIWCQKWIFFNSELVPSLLITNTPILFYHVDLHTSPDSASSLSTSWRFVSCNVAPCFGLKASKFTCESLRDCENILRGRLAAKITVKSCKLIRGLLSRPLTISQANF